VNRSSKTTTLIVGCGYLGKRVAEGIQTATGETVYATTRSREKAAKFAAQGIVPILADWTDRRTLRSLPDCDRVLVAVSYDARSGIPREESQVGGLSNLLDFCPENADICYISTTGVYHQTDGQWVDETSPARPARGGGAAHLRAESLLHRRRPTARWTILRLAGIYGPDRVPRASDVLNRRPIEGPYGGYLNLIHVQDAASTVMASWEAVRPSRLYVVSDDLPVIRQRFYEEVATCAGAPPPIFATQGAGFEKSTLSARSASNKRVWNRRFRRELMPKLAFPTYREGLRSLNFARRQAP